MSHNNQHLPKFRIPIQKFDKNTNTWVQYRPERLESSKTSLSLNQKVKSLFSSKKSTQNAPSSPEFPQQLKVATFNVWFDKYCLTERYNQIASLIQTHNPDIICFQEVIPSFLEIILGDSFIQDNYYASDVPQGRAMTNWYGVMILSKFPGEFGMQELPTQMGRDCRFVDVHFANGWDVRVATVHLESMENASTRRNQLEIIKKEVLSSHAFSMLMGDFNFDSDRNYTNYGPLENLALSEVLGDYWDAHDELGGTRMHSGPNGAIELNRSGKTFDSDRNSNIKQFEMMRYDRIMVRKNPQWKCVDMIALGDEPFMKDQRTGGNMFPSDHFGLMVTVEACGWRGRLL